MSGTPPAHSNSRCAAFFDVDGTLIDTTIVHYFVYFKLRRTPRWKSRLWLPWFFCKCGAYLLMDQLNRGWLNAVFYRNYATLPALEIKSAAADCVETISRSRWLAGARDKVSEHRRAGHDIVLVTGSLDFLMAPLAQKLGGAAVLAATLEEREKTFTGRLVGRPVIAEEKRRLMDEYARQHGIDMAQCHAYGDSSADLPMLEAVGFPHAVNPNRKLRSVARRRGWPIHDWPVENAKGREAR